MKRRIICFFVLISTIMLFFTACDIGTGNSTSGGNNVDKDITVMYYLTEGGSAVQVKPNGGVFDIIEVPERIGYEFLGLYDNANGGSQIVDKHGKFNVQVNKSVTLYARWKALPYVFTFVPGEGTLEDNESSMSVLCGETLGKFPTPKREGYKFVGWYDESGARYSKGENVIEEKNVLSDNAYDLASGGMTLYAKWEKLRLSVVFDYNDGSYNTEYIEGDYGFAIEPSDFPEMHDNEARGLEFVGWSLDRTMLVEFNGRVTKDVTLYAVWREYKTLSIYTEIGGESEYVRIYRTDVYECPVPKKEHYILDGWYTSKLFSGIPLTSVRFSDGVTSVYARWKPVEYGIRFVTGCDVTVDDAIYTVEGPFSLPSPQRAGYKFIGWCMNEDCTDGAKLTIPAGTSGDITLYAVWEANENTLQFNAGLGTGTMKPIKVHTDETIKLPTCGFWRDGYEFIGWSKTEGSTSVDYAPRAEYTMGTDETANLYAVWKGKPNKVIFNANGGSGTMADFSIATGEKGTLPKNEFVKSGYIFAGWATDANGEKAYDDGDIFAVDTAGDRKLYALWIPAEYKITYESNGGSKVDGSTYTILDTVTLPVAEKENYIFAGWYKDPRFEGGKTEVLSGSHGDITFYAKWIPVDYTVRFDSCGGTAINSMVYNVESNTFLLPESERNGYVFDGWFDAEGKKHESIGHGSVGDIELTAKWSLKSYKVSFAVNGGKDISDVFYTIESETLYLPEAEREGYKFDGWYADEAFGGEAIANIPTGSTGDRVYYAKWSAVDYTVKFDSDGGTSVSDMLYNIENGISELPRPTKIGYAFEGWADAEGKTVEAIPDGITGDIQLVAKWKANTYTVIYDPNGGKGRVDSSAHVYGEEKALNANAFTKTGYEFLGWALSEGGDVICDGAAVKDLTPENGAEVILYAQWKPVSYTITYNNTAGVSNSNPLNYTVEDNIILEAMVRTGYNFVGWYDGAGKAVTEIPTNTMGDIVLFAVWDAKKYSVSFDSNLGEGNMEVVENIRYDKTFTLPENKFIREHYEFIGWATAPDGEVKYNNGQNVSNLAQEGNVTLYAKWSPVNYTVTFVSGGGTTLPKIKYNVETDTFELPVSERKGYSFEGWYTGRTFEGEKTVSVQQGSTGDITLYAKWELVDYTVTFDSLGGTEVPPFTYTVIDDTKELPLIEKEGYIFAGWFDASDKKYESVEHGSAGNIELMAKWEAIEYKVIFNTNGGDAIENIIYTIESETFALPVPVKEGYFFRGWYKNSDLSGERASAVSCGSVGDITLYAAWKQVDKLYSSLDDISVEEIITENKIIIDLSSYTGTVTANKKIVILGSSEVLFIGGKGATFNNITIDCRTNKALNIIFEDFSMNGNIVGNENELILTFIGDSCIAANSAANATIYGFANLTLNGTGNVSVIGGNGAGASSDGSAGESGGAAIIADNVVLDLNGKLTLRGGNGGNGGRGSMNQIGGNGGNGGDALVCSTLHIKESTTLNSYGGKGGMGGQGGMGRQGDQGRPGKSATDNGGWGKDASAGGTGGQGTQGAPGGMGGAGGSAVIVTESFVNESENAYFIGGSGGQGGTGGTGGQGGTGGRGGEDDWWGPGTNKPGRGGQGGQGGTGGTGGRGGENGIGICKGSEVTIEGVAAGSVDGQPGQGGEAGDGGPRGNGGRGGDGGNYGKDGADGDPGWLGNPGQPGEAGAYRIGG